MVILAISELGCSCWCASSICMNRSGTRMSHGPRIGRIYVTQNDNKPITKTITKITRKPASNTIAHGSLRHGDSPQRGKTYLQLCSTGRTQSNFSMAAACAWTSSGLLDYDGMPKACKTIRKKKNDKVKRSIADLYVFFTTSCGKQWDFTFLLFLFVLVSEMGEFVLCIPHVHIKAYQSCGLGSLVQVCSSRAFFITLLLQHVAHHRNSVLHSRGGVRPRAVG